MKKFVLLLFAILLPNICFAKENIYVSTKNNEGFISNKRALITDVRKDGAIGFICPKWAIYKNDCYSGAKVFFNINFNDDIIDYQRFDVPKGYCFYANGSYTYKVKRHIKHTIRSVELRKKDKNNKNKKVTLFKLRNQ